MTASPTRRQQATLPRTSVQRSSDGKVWTADVVIPQWLTEHDGLVEVACRRLKAKGYQTRTETITPKEL